MCFLCGGLCLCYVNNQDKKIAITKRRKQAVANRDRLLETMQQQQANNQEQEQEHNFGLADPIAWEMTQDTYPESVALFTRALRSLDLQSEESLQRLAFWLVRSRAGVSITRGWHVMGYNDEKHARKCWASDNVLRHHVDYPNFERKLRQFLAPRPAWKHL